MNLSQAKVDTFFILIHDVPYHLTHAHKTNKQYSIYRNMNKCIAIIFLDFYKKKINEINVMQSNTR